MNALNLNESAVNGITINQIENLQEYLGVINDMTCPLCLNVVCKPLECYECRLLFCEACYQILAIAGKTCITNKCKGNVKKANKFVREVLSNFKITCVFCNKSRMSYVEYITHLDKCNSYQQNPAVQLLKQLNEKEEKIDQLQKDLEKAKSKPSKKVSQISQINLTKEEIRNRLMTINLPVNMKMELYNACVEGKVEDFKKLILQRNFPLLEEVSAHNYYWTTIHYAMHYGQFEIVKFICDRLLAQGNFEIAMRLESNDNRCPLLCLLRSNSLGPDKKKELLKKFLAAYGSYFTLSGDVKKEIKARDFESVLR